MAAAALGLAVAAASCWSVATLDPRFLDPLTGRDVWFEADIPRVADDIVHRFAAHSRATVHPLFSLFACGLAYPLRALGCPPPCAIAIVAGASAAFWTACFFAMLRLLDIGRVHALLFTAIAATSAAGLFWLTVPETYASGSATILLALAVAALAERRPIRDTWLVLASASSLSITVTNWVAGWAAAFALRPWRRALQITANAFALVVVLWSVQRVFVPRADFFIGYSNEQRYLLRPEAGGPLRILETLTMHAVVMPPVAIVEKPLRGRVMSVQRDGAFSGGRVHVVALALWLTLLTAGAWRAARAERAHPAVRVLAAVIGAEYVLHLLYGTETFLYALNVAPLLVAVAAFAVTARARRLATALAVAMLVLASANNVREWKRARAFYGYTDRSNATQAREVHYR